MEGDNGVNGESVEGMERMCIRYYSELSTSAKDGKMS